MRTFGVVALVLLAACSEPEGDGGGCVGACDGLEFSDILGESYQGEAVVRCEPTLFEETPGDAFGRRYGASCSLVGGDTLQPRTVAGSVQMLLGASGLDECVLTTSRPTCALSILDDPNQPLLQGNSTGRLRLGLQVGAELAAEQEHSLAMSSFRSAMAWSINTATYYSFQIKVDHERTTTGDRVRAVEATCGVPSAQSVRLRASNGWARFVEQTPEVNCNVVVHASIGGMTMPIQRNVEGIGHGDIVFASVSAGQVVVEVRTEPGESDGGPLPTDASVDG